MPNKPPRPRPPAAVFVLIGAFFLLMVWGFGLSPWAGQQKRLAAAAQAAYSRAAKESARNEGLQSILEKMGGASSVKAQPWAARVEFDTEKTVVPVVLMHIQQGRLRDVEYGVTSLAPLAAQDGSFFLARTEIKVRASSMLDTDLYTLAESLQRGVLDETHLTSFSVQKITPLTPQAMADVAKGSLSSLVKGEFTFIVYTLVANASQNDALIRTPQP
jgi:hypothetical protein